MEQCVTNKSIKRVIIICDKSYAEKADKLVGGVGDETIIISPKIYKNTKQEKFIPVVIEKNNSGEAYLPTYLSPNVYIDLTGKNYEENYTKLKEAIFGSSTKVKTQIDNHPRTEEATPISYLKKAIKKLTNNINDITARDFLNVYSASLKSFYKKDCPDITIFLDNFCSMKAHRDCFLNFLQTISESKKIALGTFLAEAFEVLHNTLYKLHFFEPNKNSCIINDFDIFKLHIWELFLCSTTYLLHHELFADIHDMLAYSYYFRTSPLGDGHFS